MRKVFLLVFFYSFSISFVFAQQHKTDSLFAVLKTEKEDTAKVNTLNSLIQILSGTGGYVKLDSLKKNAMELATKLNFKVGMCVCYENNGLTNYSQGKYSDALKDFLQCQKLANELLEEAKVTNNTYELQSGKKAMAAAYTNIGNVYDDEGNSAEALKNQLMALKLDEETGNKYGMGAAYNNIGSVYDAQGNYIEALRNYKLGLQIQQEIGNKPGIDAGYGNIGGIYARQGNYTEALKNQLQALKIAIETGDKTGMDYDYSNLGSTYQDEGNNEEALKSFSQSLKTAKEISDEYVIGSDYVSMGSIYINTKKFDEARKYIDSGFTVSKNIGSKDVIRNAYGAIIKIDSAKGNYLAAYEDYKNFILYRDSLKNEASTKKLVSEQMTFEFDKKQAVEKAEQDKKDAITEDKSKRQRIIIIFMAIIALAVAFTAIVILRSLRITRKQKVLIEQQKLIVEEQKSLVEHQKAIVDEKNKDITDSIHYASRIQRALLSTNDYLGRRLKEYFILFKPRDIVSGDFYWANEVETTKGKRFLICAGDCTGHGVPGAFMSLLNISLLNEVNLEKKINEPALILDEVREQIIKALNPDGSEKESKDGMDCVLCSFNFTNNILDFACANNPLWIVRANELIEFKPDKMPVGIQDGYKPFSAQSTQLQKGDVVYIFTDGYADQFGGPKGKKFKYKTLQELLVANSQKPMDEQKNILASTLESWKGNLEQIDDVLIIGIRV